MERLIDFLLNTKYYILNTKKASPKARFTYHLSQNAVILSEVPAGYEAKDLFLDSSSLCSSE